jgi:multidrug efflux system outer membrane protein
VRTSPQTLWRATASAAYEVDLFGRVAHAVQAAIADEQQAEALQRSLLLAIQADVAQNYLLLRWLDAEIGLLDDTVKLREDAVDLVGRRQRAGEVGEIDLARARTELSVARAERIALLRSRAEIEHGLAVLTGKAPSELTLEPRPVSFRPIAIPAGVPSTLLERRHDIAAAERAMAAANARIGVARAAWFPRLSLTGLLGFESGSLGELFRSASRTWALGPLVGTALSMTIFDGGRRRATEAGAAAVHDETVANYRQTVLGALREVEDNLSALRFLAQQAQENGRSVESARRAADLSSTRYRAGYVGYLEVIDAERQVLATQRAALQTDRERALATVSLVRALGGGWQRPDPALASTAAPASP